MPFLDPEYVKRIELGVNFSGHDDSDKIPCPSELLRPRAVVNQWGGNVPQSTT